MTWCSMLKSLAVAPFIIALTRREGFAQRTEGTTNVEALPKNRREYLPDGADVILSTEPLKRPPGEWKQSLAPQRFDVLRPHPGPPKEGTPAGLIWGVGPSGGNDEEVPRALLDDLYRLPFDQLPVDLIPQTGLLGSIDQTLVVHLDVLY